MAGVPPPQSLPPGEIPRRFKFLSMLAQEGPAETRVVYAAFVLTDSHM